MNHHSDCARPAARLIGAAVWIALLFACLTVASCGRQTETGARYAFSVRSEAGQDCHLEADSAEELTALVTAWRNQPGAEPLFGSFRCSETSGLLYRTADVSFSDPAVSGHAVCAVTFPYPVSACSPGSSEGRVWTVRLPEDGSRSFAASAEQTSTVFLLCAAGVLSVCFLLFFVFSRKARRAE